MLTIYLHGKELFDEEKSTFFTVDDVEVQLEHSLVSVSKWESKHKVPFLSKTEKTTDQILDYIKCMVLNSDPSVVERFSPKDIESVQEYIDSTESATSFSDGPSKTSSRELITAELIYYWLIAYNIPFEVENWHINRLLALVKICNIKNQKPKKMPKHEMAQKYRALNEQRLKQYNTSG